MLNWDLTITSMIIFAAAYYVVLSSYKTIKGASSGCNGGCSGCSHCHFATTMAVAPPAKKSTEQFSAENTHSPVS